MQKQRDHFRVKAQDSRGTGWWGHIWVSWEWRWPHAMTSTLGKRVPYSRPPLAWRVRPNFIRVGKNDSILSIKIKLEAQWKSEIRPNTNFVSSDCPSVSRHLLNTCWMLCMAPDPEYTAVTSLTEFPSSRSLQAEGTGNQQRSKK